MKAIILRKIDQCSFREFKKLNFMKSDFNYLDVITLID